MDRKRISTNVRGHLRYVDNKYISIPVIPANNRLVTRETVSLVNTPRSAAQPQGHLPTSIFKLSLLKRHKYEIKWLEGQHTSERYSALDDGSTPPSQRCPEQQIRRSQRKWRRRPVIFQQQSSMSTHQFAILCNLSASAKSVPQFALWITWPLSVQ